MREQAVNDQCPSLADLVLASDGGLSLSHKAGMTAHLDRCESCRERLRQANAFLEATADLVDDEGAMHASGVRAGDVGISGVDVSRAGVGGVVDGVSGRVAVVAGNVVKFPGISERAGNARAAMPIGFEDTIGADYDSDAKAEARIGEFARNLHEQKQKLIHRPTATTAWVRRWMPVAALIPLLILGLALPRMQAVVRADELLTLASNHERSLPANHSQTVRIQLTPGIPAFTEVTGGAREDMLRVKPVFGVRYVTGGVVRDAGPGGAGASGEYAAVAAMLSSHGFDFSQPLSVDALRAWRSSLGDKRDEVFVSSNTLMLKTTASIGALRSVEVTVRRRDFHVLKLEFAIEGMGRLEIAEIPPATMPRAVKASPVAPVAPTVTAPVAMDASSSLAARGVVVDASLSPVTTVVGRAPVSQPALSLWLERTFRSSPERKAFVPTLQRLVGDLRQHLSELDTLGRRYPEVELVEQWSGADRAELRRRVEESYRRIGRDLNDLELRVSVLFGSRTRSFPLTEAPADWRERAAAALAHAEALDGQVRDLLNFDDVPVAGTGGAGAARMPATFGALWDVVHAPAGGPASR